MGSPHWSSEMGSLLTRDPCRTHVYGCKRVDQASHYTRRGEITRRPRIQVGTFVKDSTEVGGFVGKGGIRSRGTKGPGGRGESAVQEENRRGPTYMYRTEVIPYNTSCKYPGQEFFSHPSSQTYVCRDAGKILMYP